MNLGKLPKEKRNQLVLIVVCGLVTIAGLGFGLIRPQYQHLALQAEKKASTEKELQQIRDSIKNAGRQEEELAEARKALADAESDTASGDLYSWAINTLRRFKAGYRVEIPQFSPIGPVVDMNMVPGFPYKQATLSVAGTARFHDFGRFLADFENQFPHVRVLNLNLELNASPLAEEQETLAFKMDIVTLVRPNPS